MKIPTFRRTIIPVRMMLREGEFLISRARARRFKTVVPDFEGVEMIGQAFADEVFRVYQQEHENVQIESLNADRIIQKMIDHVRHT